MWFPWSRPLVWLRLQEQSWEWPLHTCTTTAPPPHPIGQFPTLNLITHWPLLRWKTPTSHPISIFNGRFEFVTQEIEAGIDDTDVEFYGVCVPFVRVHNKFKTSIIIRSQSSTVVKLQTKYFTIRSYILRRTRLLKVKTQNDVKLYPQIRGEGSRWGPRARDIRSACNLKTCVCARTKHWPNHVGHSIISTKNIILWMEISNIYNIYNFGGLFLYYFFTND